MSALLVVVATVAAACASAEGPEVGDVPVVVAEPVPADESTLAELSQPAPTPDTTPDTTPSPAEDLEARPSPTPAAPAGPTSADAAAFLAGPAGEGLRGLEHVLVDLDGDEQDEVVVAGIREQQGVLRVAWWSGGAYAVLSEDVAGPGDRIEDLRAADVNLDEQVEVAISVEGQGIQSLALWAVPGRGDLDRLEAIGGCHDDSHVYGVTTARLASPGDAPADVVADCDESPLPVADWSEQRWEWRDGAYRHVEVVPLPSPSPDGPGRGRGNGGNPPGQSGGGSGGGEDA